jgi:hypothetical protein
MADRPLKRAVGSEDANRPLVRESDYKRASVITKLEP